MCTTGKEQKNSVVSELSRSDHSHLKDVSSVLTKGTLVEKLAGALAVGDTVQQKGVRLLITGAFLRQVLILVELSQGLKVLRSSLVVLFWPNNGPEFYVSIKDFNCGVADPVTDF